MIKIENTERLKIIDSILGENSSQRLRISFFKKNHSSVYNTITNFCIKMTGLELKEQLWHWVNDIPEHFLCVTCNENRTTFNKNWKDGYRKYCSAKCSAISDSTKEKRKETCIEVYGVDNVAKNIDIQKKIEDTNMERYGCKSTFQNQEVRDKWTTNIQEKYGVDHIFQLPNVIESIKEKRQIYLNENFEGKELFTTNFFKDKSNTTTQIRMLDKFGFKSDEYEFLEYNNRNLDSVYSEFVIKHNTCNNTFIIKKHNLSYRLSTKLELCSHCYTPDIKSGSEKELCEWVKSHVDGVIDTDKTILNPKHLDIYIPSHNLAIEFNGLYFHSDLYKDETYHLNKFIGCSDKGIHLINVWEDDWKFRNDIVKSIILNKLGLITNKIYARKCIIKEVPYNISRDFLNLNHIQGVCNSNINYGLYYKDELVSLMTFGSRSINNSQQLELLRFCNKLNLNVIGGASKLFKHFISNNDFNEIVSFADLSIFDGNLYKILGFEFIHRNKPNYWWVVNGHRKHRFTYNKKKLVKDGFDPNKTEIEIMHDEGYYRIFGVGMDKWVYKK